MHKLIKRLGKYPPPKKEEGEVVQSSVTPGSIDYMKRAALRMVFEEEIQRKIDQLSDAQVRWLGSLSFFEDRSRSSKNERVGLPLTEVLHLHGKHLIVRPANYRYVWERVLTSLGGELVRARFPERVQEWEGLRKSALAEDLIPAQESLIKTLRRDMRQAENFLANLLEEQESLA